jgi:hypothetical protein
VATVSDRRPPQRRPSLLREGAAWCFQTQDALDLLSRQQRGDAHSLRSIYVALTQLAGLAHSNTFEARIADIAARACVSDRTVSKSWPVLAALRLVAVTPRRAGGQNLPHLWTLTDCVRGGEVHDTTPGRPDQGQVVNGNAPPARAGRHHPGEACDTTLVKATTGEVQEEEEEGEEQEEPSPPLPPRERGGEIFSHELLVSNGRKLTFESGRQRDQDAIDRILSDWVRRVAPDLDPDNGALAARCLIESRRRLEPSIDDVRVVAIRGLVAWESSTRQKGAR